ncbi:TIGR04255 family protein [Nonomuraea angiospora]
MYERREIYSAPPLQLVVAEIRYPFAPRLRQPESLDRIQIDLEELLPIRHNERQTKLEFSSDGSRNSVTIDIFRLTDKSSTVSAVIGPESTAIETTSYREFPAFLAFVERVADALERRGRVTALQRLGLRYVDEIRVPEQIHDASDWCTWVAPELVPVRDGRMPVQSFHTTVTYKTGLNTLMRFQCAALEGTGLIADGVLKRRTPAISGPFFVLDIDSFWQAPSPDQVEVFDVQHIREMFTSLHAPTGERFQDSLTDQLRAVFRKEAAV